MKNTKPPFSVSLTIKEYWFRHPSILPKLSYWGSTVFQAKTSEKKKVSTKYL